MNRFTNWFAASVGLAATVFYHPLFAVTIETVPVGNPGNVADSTSFGAVADSFLVGATEVTNDQYAEFLNAVAGTDSHSLYNSKMGSDARGGIFQSGSIGSFTYGVKTNMGNKPINFVSFWDATRFTNWLHNGQTSGAQDNTTTEDGAYFLNGATNPNNVFISREPHATWFLPTEDQWYKAAFHQPASEGGDSDDYWLYPTASNSEPAVATANGVGDISNSGANIANYILGTDWNGQNGNVTTVGSAGVLSESFYGTFDQAGNVWEWSETVIDTSERIMRGGAWNVSSATLDVFNRSSVDPVNDSSNIGFRVASVFTPASSPGNFDLDGDVDGFDFLMWQRGESPNPLSESDLADWEVNYGTVTSPFTAASTTVPEPSTWITLLFGMMAVHFRRDVVVSPHTFSENTVNRPSSHRH